MENFYQVKVKNETKAYKVGTTYGEIADDFLHLYSAQPVLAFVKGRLREFHKCLKEDSVIDFVTLEDTIGYSAYQRSMVFLMLKAFYHVVGKENIEKIVLHYSIGSGFYFTLRGKVNLDAQVMENVKSYMRKLVEEKLPIEKRNIGTKAAIDLFHFHGMTDKEKLFRFRRVSRVNIYKLGNFEDYFYGYMLWHTGYLKLFDLFCYDEGFVLHLPKRKAMDRLPVFKEEPKLFAIQQKSEKWGEMLNVDTVGSLNECIAKEKMKELILIQEALQEGELSKIAEQIKAKEGIKFVMIAGPSSSGKTTFSHRLSIQLLAHGLKPHPIAVDNYFVNREDTPLDEFGNKNYECLEAIDIEQFNKDMRSLAAGERVELPEFNFKTGKREYKGNFLQLGKEDILVIEGIHCLNDALSYSLSKESKFKIYISAVTQLNIDEHNRIPTTDGRLIRRMVRDNRTRGASAKHTIGMWESVRRGETENIFPYQESADVMFNSALIYELGVLKTYAEPILFQIEEGEAEYQEAKRLLKFLDYFLPISPEDVPNNSFLREFIGKGCFDI